MTARTVVLVDLDDTCLPDLAATRSAIVQTLGEVGLNRNLDVAVDYLLAAARSRWHTSPFRKYCLTVGISSWEGLWLRSADDRGPAGFAAWAQDYKIGVWSDFARGVEIDVEAADIAHRYLEIRQLHARAYPGALDVLERIRNRHRLWLITNGDSELQRRKADLAGISDLAERISVSGDVGFAKPDDRFFAPVESAIEARGMRVALVIGDSVRCDIEPAIRRGWPAVLVNSDKDMPGVFRVNRLADLPGSAY